MSFFTKTDSKVLQSSLLLTAGVREEGTGKFYGRFFCSGKLLRCSNLDFFFSPGTLFTKQKIVELSYIIGKLSFVDTPKTYNQGSILEGKVC